MSTKTLYYKKPLVRTFLDYAYLFGVAERGTPLEDYLFSMYGSLIFIDPRSSDVFDPLDLFPGPRLRQASQAGAIDAVGHDLWRLGNIELVEFVAARIEGGEYCLVTLDEFFIEGKASFGKQHFIHHNLTIGWDEEKQSVGLVGYISGKNSDFDIFWVPIDVFLRALDFDAFLLPENQGQEIFALSSYKYIISYKPNITAKPIDSLGLFVRATEEYLGGNIGYVNNHNKDLTNSSAAFGINIYDGLINYLQDVEPGRHPAHLLHILRIFSEHKILIREKLKHLERSNGIQIGSSDWATIDGLCESAKALRTLGMALRIGKTTSSLDHLVEIIRSCRDLEERELPRLLANLRGAPLNTSI